jgi:hypothetical protein
MTYDPQFVLLQQKQKEIEERLSPGTIDHQSTQFNGWRAERQYAMRNRPRREQSKPMIADLFHKMFWAGKLKSR